jgi:hypothetical protein
MTAEFILSYLKVCLLLYGVRRCRRACDEESGDLTAEHPDVRIRGLFPHDRCNYAGDASEFYLNRSSSRARPKHG